jgi:hypothetical protein
MKKIYILTSIFVMFCFSSYAADWTKVTTKGDGGTYYAFLKMSETTCYGFCIAIATSYPYDTKTIVHKTTDGGATWDTIPRASLVLGGHVFKAVTTGTNIYVLGDNGLYKSTDNAGTWTLIKNTELNTVATATYDIWADGTTIYVANYNGLFKTTDEFASLTNINYNLKFDDTHLYGVKSVAKLNGRLYASAVSKVYYLEGETWTLCTGILDEQSNFNKMAYVNSHYYISNQSNADALYVIYHSTDGKAWTKIDESYIYDFTIANNYMWATKIVRKSFTRYFVYTNNETLTDIGAGLPTFFQGTGVVVLGSNLFLGVKDLGGNSGIYTRSISSLVTSVSNNTIHKDLLYPNVVTNVLKIKSDNIYTSYSIVNANGQVIENNILKNNQINVKSLNAGLYFIVLTTKDGYSSKNVIVKK